MSGCKDPLEREEQVLALIKVGGQARDYGYQRH
jgi:hypothetical protein